MKLAQDANGEVDEEEDAETKDEEGITAVEERTDRDSEEKIEGGEEEIEGVQDRSNISETKEHLHLDVLDQQMAETQRVRQSHKSSNGSETIFTIIAEEITKEELPQPIGRAPPDRRRPRIRCRSFISTCGDTIVDVNDSDRLNAVENNGVFVLKIKRSQHTRSRGRRRRTTNRGRRKESRRNRKRRRREEEKKIHERARTVAVRRLNRAGFGNGLQIKWPNSKITEKQNGLVGNRDARNELPLINQIRPNNTAQSGQNQHTQTQWNEMGGAEVFQVYGAVGQRPLQRRWLTLVEKGRQRG